MRRPGSRSALRRRFTLTLGLACLLGIVAFPSSAGAVARVKLPSEVAATASSQDPAQVARYWTPARMRSARPLSELRRAGALEPIASAPALASILPGPNGGFTGVPDTTLPPYRAVGRIFFEIGRFKGFCSGTAIDSPTRRLVLTAGHCLYGLLPFHRHPTLSRKFNFVPGYANGQAPFGEFVGETSYLLRPWLRRFNENFDMAAVLTAPNALGQNVADAVEGGIRIATDRPRDQEYRLLGYPGRRQQRMHECEAPFAGDDEFSYRLGGPPSLGAACRMGHGASGGPWLINEGTEINGMTSHGLPRDFSSTYGPYFSRRNVGALVKGF